MLMDDNFDADDVLRDMDEMYADDEYADDNGDARELNFGNTFDENANFVDMVSDLDTTEDMWE